ncbi:MAG: bifunctional phosphoribosyl-AMP cyclohydrolase/phosphoribosyl-ATP diphosphatase HisIE [Anaerotignum sp.]|jgi:phosphoribosyl-ATP pyrophosphohydrolase/phosphoribosyl-AMP cyclohydrolase|nr:bifunctional phosphoribosyl-AMP cyclohydrolase/phosphoribosyl-ATP diphosphatase HisIE [Anaerotignum sp.]MBR4283743.1 bifunctional phosphoribosyl-AMP cyclohydrolase/phosphoribosyl-ATP diphosphatase HisIE [Anaerotignum sp.]
MLKIEDLKFDEKGLIPAVVVDTYSKKVLTVAYMNKESLQISMDEGRTCFWSRSRQELWRKGDTSGNVQHIVSIVADCDRDALTVEVVKEGPACHLGTESCFNDVVYLNPAYNQFSMDNLFEMLEGRKANMPEGSYTTYLFEKGIDKILKKIGEECTEVIIASKAEDKAETIYEIADLAYHVMVMMVEQGITLEDVRKELASRHVIDHKVKQEKMTK